MGVSVMCQHTEEEHHELQALSEHLLYEIEMLKYTRDRIEELHTGVVSADENHEYALFESFLIHTRNIYEFLFKKEKRKITDVRADDFREDDPYPIPCSVDKFLNDWAGNMINKRLVHLTTDRLTIDETKRKWDVDRLYQDLCGQLITFYVWVPYEHLCAKLKSKKEEALDDVQNKLEQGESVVAPSNSTIVMDTGSPSVPVIKPLD